MAKFGDLEAAVMDVLWSAGRACTIREVLGALTPSRPLAYTTVQTVMDRLTKKDLLVRVADGKAFTYTPAASRDDHAARLMQAALESSANPGSALLHFVERMDAAQQAALLAAVRRHDASP